MVGRFGIPVEPGGEMSLARGITRVMEMPAEHRVFMARNARDNAMTYFSQTRSIWRYQMVYLGVPDAGTTPVAEVVPEPIVEVVPEPVVAAPANVRTRLSERNVDLPIEVSEDERRLHNDARRFARLLVSEIKLYNEQKVKEGREANDLYEKLKEAIDRSREMYDKRVQPPVAAKFDYFHYELVSNLAEGDEGKLGSSYVGTTI